MESSHTEKPWSRLLWAPYDENIVWRRKIALPHPISTTLITICVWLLNALQAERRCSMHCDEERWRVSPMGAVLAGDEWGKFQSQGDARSFPCDCKTCGPTPVCALTSCHFRNQIWREKDSSAPLYHTQERATQPQGNLALGCFVAVSENHLKVSPYKSEELLELRLYQSWSHLDYLKSILQVQKNNFKMCCWFQGVAKFFVTRFGWLECQKAVTP